MLTLLCLDFMTVDLEKAAIARAICHWIFYALLLLQVLVTL